jgi:hypothetical protein
MSPVPDDTQRESQSADLPELDLEALAEIIMEMLRHELLVENERLGQL